MLAWQLPFLGRQVVVQQDSRAVLIAAGVICLVGVLDDLFDLPALTKFAGQVLAAGIVVALGVRMLWIPLPGQTISLDGAASVAITVFFIVLCSNAVNFVDGLDGLATGVVGIGALALLRLLLPADRQPGPDPGHHLEPDHRGHRRRLPGFPAAQLLPGPDVHGRLRGDAARTAARHVDDQPDRTDRHLAADRRHAAGWCRPCCRWCCR